MGKRFGSATEIFGKLFPDANTQKPRDPNEVWEMKKPADVLPGMQSQIPKPKVGIPPEARKKIDEIRAKAQQRKDAGGSLLGIGDAKPEDMVCNPAKKPNNGSYEVRTKTGMAVSFANFKDGKKHGVQKNYKNGKLSQVLNYKLDVLHGDHIMYYDTGACKAKMSYKEGKLEGLMVRYKQNGFPIIKMNFKNNVQHGMYIMYGEDGEMNAKMPYVKGKLHGVSRFYAPKQDPDADPELVREVAYVEGLMEGAATTFYPYSGGAVFIEENYKKGLREGLYTEHHQNGKMKVQRTYEKGKLVKTTPTYNDKGKEEKPPASKASKK